jgi:hypothetical protein
MFLLTSDLKELERTAPAEKQVNLLPAFDPWTVGASRDVDAFMARKHRPRIYRTAGWITAVILVNGVVDGVWKWERKGSKLLVTMEALNKLEPWAKKAAEAEADRLAEHLDAKLELSWGKV